MNCYLVTEGERGRSLLEALFREHSPHNITVVGGRGRSAAVSVAGTLLVKYTNPVGLIVDGDTVNDDQIADTKADLQALLQHAAPAERSRVFLAVPELEIIFFEGAAAEKLNHVFPDSMTEERRIRSRFEPRKVLAEILKEHNEEYDNTSGPSLVRRLGCQTLCEHRLIQEIEDFINRRVERMPA